MDFHLLVLQGDEPPEKRNRLPQVVYDHLEPFPSSNGDLAPASIINLREWTHFALNEGSFLRAYCTYEFFERGPPSLIRSINSHVFVKDRRGFYHARPALHNLRSFTYTAIFPFANHMDSLGLLPQLETLDLQFAPDPESMDILDDTARTGRVELQDCWQEVISGYHDIATAISTFRMSKEAFPRLKEFRCQDLKNVPALQEDLDQIFTPLCLPVWAEYEPGMFKRIADKAEFPGMDAII